MRYALVTSALKHLMKHINLLRDFLVQYNVVGSNFDNSHTTGVFIVSLGLKLLVHLVEVFLSQRQKLVPGFFFEVIFFLLGTFNHTSALIHLVQNIDGLFDISGYSDLTKFFFYLRSRNLEL